MTKKEQRTANVQVFLQWWLDGDPISNCAKPSSGSNWTNFSELQILTSKKTQSTAVISRRKVSPTPAEIPERCVQHYEILFTCHRNTFTSPGFL